MRGISGNRLFKMFSSRKPQEPPPPPPLPPSPLPQAFLCPICSLIMEKPVVIPSGHSCDKACIQACRNLNFSPAHLNLDVNNIPSSSAAPSSSSSSSLPPPPDDDEFPIIPNLNLYQAILNWCLRSGHPLPSPASPQFADHLVKGLISNPSLPHPPFPPHYSFDLDKEQWILKTIADPKYSSKETALLTLLNTPVCSPRVLAALKPFLGHGFNSKLQVIASKVLLKLALEPENRTPIIRAGSVPPLISVVSLGIRHASSAAAGALYRLALDESSRLLIGALGAIPVLLDKFCENFLGHSGWKDAGMALYQLTLCMHNAKVLVEDEGVEKLMEVAQASNSPTELKGSALMLVYHLVGIKKAREELLDKEGRIAALLKMVREGGVVGLYSHLSMYTVCKLSMVRFREVARVAGAEEVLAAEEVEGWDDIRKEMAREMVRVIRGECTQMVVLNEVAGKNGESEIVELKEGVQDDPKGKKFSHYC